MTDFPIDPRTARRIAALEAEEAAGVYDYNLASEDGRRAYIEYNCRAWEKDPARKSDWRGQVSAHVAQGLIVRIREVEAANLIHAYLLETEPMARVVEYRATNDILYWRVISVNGWGHQMYVDLKQTFEEEASASEEARRLNEALESAASDAHAPQGKENESMTTDHEDGCMCPDCQDEESAFWQGVIMPILFPGGVPLNQEGDGEGEQSDD